MNTNIMRRPGRFGIWELGFGIVLTMVLGAAACTPSEVKTTPASPSPAASPVTTASPVTSPSGSPAVNAPVSKVDGLVGRWPGTGNGYLNVTKKGDKYSIEIAGAEGPKTFEGTA